MKTIAATLVKTYDIYIDIALLLHRNPWRNKLLLKKGKSRECWTKTG
jgi:hypothetical protein